MRSVPCVVSQECSSIQAAFTYCRRMTYGNAILYVVITSYHIRWCKGKRLTLDLQKENLFLPYISP
jgi:hypothetical protein